MYVRLLLAATLLLASSVGAQEPVGQFGPYHWQNGQLRFPNGDTLTVYRVKFWRFRDGSPSALQLEYESPEPVSDTASLRRDLRRVWPVFSPYVDALHLTRAIVTATNLTRHGMPPSLWTANFKSHGFVLERVDSGGWKVRGEPSNADLLTSSKAGVYRIFDADGTRFLPEGVERSP